MLLDRINLKVNKYSKAIILLFFIIYLVIGLLIFRDYGISWDEGSSRTTGLLAYNYIFKGDYTLLGHQYRFYGTAFEVPLIIVEKVFDLSTTRAIYFSRHLMTFIFHYISTISFFFLSKKIFKNWRPAILATLFLILSPRIFAHSFYNSKDLILMSSFIISIYAIILFIEQQNILRLLFAVITNAFTIGIRINGLILVLFLFLFFIFETIRNKKEYRIYLFYFCSYLILLASFVVIFWPLLWKDPINNFLGAFRQMSRFDVSEKVILYLGEYIKSTQIPWHYTLTWITVTTPIVYSLGFITGIVYLVKRVFKDPNRFYIDNRYILLSLFWFILPLVVVVILRSALYDAWRHMFFIYPGFIIVAIFGISNLIDYIRSLKKPVIKIALKYLITAMIILNLSWVLYFMIGYHPYQNVFFNYALYSDMKMTKYNFELDYWGLSYRKGLEYILSNDKRDKIEIFVANQPGVDNINILEEKDKERIIYADNIEDADYFLSNYRWHRKDYPYEDLFYSIDINGEKILAVYKLN